MLLSFFKENRRAGQLGLQEQPRARTPPAPPPVGDSPGLD
jgi:hypothetical protein